MGRDGQVSALALFSAELRRARSAAGLTRDQLAERVGYSPTMRWPGRLWSVPATSPGWRCCTTY
jgi:hypothetical protein